jgi:oligoribonuclease
MTDRMVWIDVETTGLNPEDSLLLEVGVRVTDLDLNEVARFSQVVGHSRSVLDQARSECGDFVLEMHSASGLWNACDEVNPDVFSIDTILSAWVTRKGLVGEPLCGSSLRLDRDFIEFFLPKTAEKFHYRSIDNSTIKELCRRYNPDLFAKVADTEATHRVDDCLDASIAEFRFYLENFLFDGRV